MRRTLMRGLTVVGAAVIGVVLVAGPAAAHVTVNPSSATQGGYAKVAFRVPNEKDGAQTVKVEINIPTDKPIASVSLRPLSGWTGVTEKAKLAVPIKTDDGEITESVAKITWTAAEGSGIQPGQFQEFEVSFGPLPEVDQIVFKALQTYSNGDVVRWIDEPRTDGTEVEHPAPTLKLAKAATAADTPVAATTTSSPSDDSPLLGIVAAALALAALVTALLAYRKADTRAS